MIKILASDGGYKEKIREYKKSDGIIAVVFYAFFMAAYYLTGVVKARYSLYLGVPVNLLLAALCIGIVLVRKQKLSSVGITTARLKKSLITGSVAGVLFVLIGTVLPAVFSGSGLNSAPKIFYNIVYYFVVIALVEEVVFRGFIQTRLYGIVKNDAAAVVLGALMFSAMHIPYQMAAANTNLTDFILGNGIWLTLLTGWHVVFNFLYRKYDTIWTGTVFHGFMDWGGSLLL